MVNQLRSKSASTGKLLDQRWQIAAPQTQQAEEVSQATDLSPLLAQVLLNRGFETSEAAIAFLNPETQVLPSPLEDFSDLPLSLELLINAINSRQRIAICGDYDADGMTSTALLLRALRSLGALVEYAIPNRMKDGYGINQRIVDEFYEEGVGLILTVDNGIAAYQPVAHARELGMTVIITDHHDLPPELPPANAILNPKLLADTSPYCGLAGVGVAYVLAISLAQSLGKAQGLCNPLLELFTLGTIADLAPLTGVNRRWVRRGLQLLPKSKLAGVQALVQVSGLSGAKDLKPEAIGFRLGPRINAVGRLADPQIVIELLTTDDPGTALERAMQCEQINQQRQQLCEQIEQEAIALCEATVTQIQHDRVLLLVQPNWHHGVIGIVASRLVERYGVPVFIGTFEDRATDERTDETDETDNQIVNHPAASSAVESVAKVRGSARSIPEFHVFEALEFCKDVLEKHGGHRAAGGFSLKAENLELFRDRLRTFAHQQLQLEHLKPLVVIDGQASLEQVNHHLYAQIDALHPCGIANPEPVFWSPNVQVCEQKIIGKGHLKLTVQEAGAGRKIQAIAWRWGDYYPLPKYIDIAYRLRSNEWNGEISIELELTGMRLPTPLSGADFTHNERAYTCHFFQHGTTKQLQIRNGDGKVLMIRQGDRMGTLSKGLQEPRAIDVSKPPYFDIIKAALTALGD